MLPGVVPGTPFANAKLPSLFVVAKLITQAEFKIMIIFISTVQFIKSFDAEQRRMRKTEKIGSLPNFARRNAQGANRKAVASG